METKNTQPTEYTITCILCHKEIKKGQERLVSCEDFDMMHGEDCNCGITVGAGCFKKHKLKRYEGI